MVIHRTWFFSRSTLFRRRPSIIRGDGLRYSISIAIFLELGYNLSQFHNEEAAKT
jgi:hypothetical protein